MGEWGIVAALPTIVHHRRQFAAKDTPPPPTNAKIHTHTPVPHRQQCQNTPPIPIPPEDHSCEGRNLKGQRPSQPHVATQHCEIPAYAGMSLWGNGELSPPCRQLSTTANNSPPPTNAKIHPHTPVPHRQQCQNTPPIPIPPEDHSCVGRNLKGQRPSQPHVATQHCEIPAYAGMSYLWTANCGGIR